MTGHVPWDVIAKSDELHILRANIAWLRCHTEVPPSVHELTGFLDELEAARTHWRKELQGPMSQSADRFLSALEGVAAKCNLMRGRREKALEHLEAAAATSFGPLPLALVLWGDILNENGDRERANQKWQEAAKFDSKEPSQLSQLLSERHVSNER